MWVKGFQAIFLASSGYERWRTARGLTDNSITSEAWLTGFAIVALALAAVLFIWAYNKRRQTEDNLKGNITDLTITTVRLRQEKDQLKKDNDRLTAINKELQNAITELSKKQVAILDNIKK